MKKRVLPINRKINGIKRRLVKRNPIIEGTAQSDPVILRGEYVRNLLWTEMAGYGGPVEVVDLIDLTQCSYDQIKTWLDVWSVHGYVSKTSVPRSITGGKCHLYEILKPSPLPPPIDLKGRPKPTENRQHIWDAVRVFSDRSLPFTTVDLITYISENLDINVDFDHAQSYLRNLCNAYYLDSTQNPQHRTPIYFMVYNTGPFAPSVRRGKSIFDPNLGVIVN